MSEQQVQPVVETPTPVAAEVVPAASSPVMQNPAQKSGGSKGLILIILVLLVVIAGGVGAFVVIQNNNNQKSDSEMSKEKEESKEKEMDEKENSKEDERGASRQSIEDLLGNITNEDDAMNELGGFLDNVYKTVSLPSSFPSDAPIFDKSGVFSVDEDETSFDIQMKYNAKDVSMDDVYEFYMDELVKKGWKIDTKSKTSISFSIIARKNDGEREIYVNGSEILDVFVSLDVTK